MDIREQTRKIASQIKSMEEKHDSSMRGVLLDQVVSEYVSLKAEETVQMYDTIMLKQKETYDSYGDIDTAATKLKIKGEIPKSYREDETTATAMFLNDIFCGEKFVIFKIERAPRDMEGEIKKRLTNVELHIRKVQKEPKHAMVDLIHYGDARDEGYCATLESKYGQKFELRDGRGMLFHYPKFEAAFRALREIYMELNQ
jgi:hypothetical protein